MEWALGSCKGTPFSAALKVKLVPGSAQLRGRILSSHLPARAREDLIAPSLLQAGAKDAQLLRPHRHGPDGGC